MSKMIDTRALSLESGFASSEAGTTSGWEDEMGAGADQLFFVTSYSDFEKLAHGPRGSQAAHSLYVYRFHPSDGSLVLLNIQGNPKVVVNPAFSRYHPRLNVVYTCTEDIEKNGQIFAYAMGDNGELTPMGHVDAGGTSTCYLTIDRARRNMLAVNYWDSTLAVIPISPETGEFLGPIKSMYDPKGGKGMVAAAKKHGGVNHSHNDECTIRQRQADPHSHALVLDPFVGTVAYVPDLGKDLIREFYYNREDASIDLELNVLPSGLCTGKPDGPRYFEFHPNYNVAYVVNELSSTVAVFEVDRALINEIAAAADRHEDMNKFRGRSTLRLIQSISTIPKAFPTHMNTCGRICVHRSGRFVIVSNRGHESIAIFRVKTKGPRRGQLCAVGYFHTRGETPRHFQFDQSGQYLIVANQDSDSIAVFTFNLSSGEIKYTGNEYRVPSPNFVCCCPMYHEDEEASMNGVPTSITSMVVGGNNNVNNKQLEEKSGAESDLESDESTVPTNIHTNNNSKEDIQVELEKARKEIAELKHLLSSMSTNTTTSSQGVM